MLMIQYTRVSLLLIYACLIINISWHMNCIANNCILQNGFVFCWIYWFCNCIFWKIYSNSFDLICVLCRILFWFWIRCFAFTAKLFCVRSSSQGGNPFKNYVCFNGCQAFCFCKGRWVCLHVFLLHVLLGILARTSETRLLPSRWGNCKFSLRPFACFETFVSNVTGKVSYANAVGYFWVGFFSAKGDTTAMQTIKLK